ncbi:Heterogeneous nuclear ribonucleoprotein L-like protein [Intoshia linei]|uniref:Heterogeneous nuclear ribonucleoprotein L-like protein n=1 Tax=Intoshia linei TaxID=1819745 RepID=A0A177BAQ9_9BILA|nr:Heterogeneous nuclear ribonucleoprotein L-like protein [Intoshia linei]
MSKRPFTNYVQPGLTRVSSPKHFKSNIDQFKSDSPCKTIVVDNVKDVTEKNILGAFKKFGRMARVLLLPHFFRALVEFEELNFAISAVNKCKEDPLKVCTNFVKVYFSRYPTISEYISNEGTVSVLKIDIDKPIYPITTNVMRKILAPYDTNLKIIIVSNSQVLVEFSSVVGANNAKRYLDGEDIYSGCCTLRISRAEFSNLNIRENSELEYAYNLNSDYHNDSFINPHFGSSSNSRNIVQPIPNAVQQYDENGIEPGNVIIVVGLTDKFNCNKLFNLLCQYGNVIKIKILKTRQRSAMIQMGNRVGCERAINCLNGCSVFGTKLQFTFSKLDFLVFPRQKAHPLADDTPSFESFAGSKLNRFSTLEDAKRHEINRPNRTLHFYNIPTSFDQEKINKTFNDMSLKEPNKIQFYGNSSKSKHGLMEWVKFDDAIDAILIAQHHSISDSASKYPYILKMNFASCLIRPTNR